jgi:hypothetical protein
VLVSSSLYLDNQEGDETFMLILLQIAEHRGQGQDYRFRQFDPCWSVSARSEVWQLNDSPSSPFTPSRFLFRSGMLARRARIQRWPSWRPAADPDQQMH